MRPLRPGDTIGIVSPAFAPDDDLYSQCRDYFADRGYRVRIFGEDSAKLGRLAGADQERLRHLEAAFGDEEVSAILCSRGGYGSGRIINQINVDLVSRNQKPVIGYSDITYMLVHINSNIGMTTFHGPMAVDLLTKKDKWTEDYFFRAVEKKLNGYSLTRENYTPLRYGTASGTLFGGNISILGSLVGTESLCIPSNSIIFLEDVNEFAYQVDRSLVHLKRAGLFRSARGVIFSSGILKDTDDGKGALGVGFAQIVRDLFHDFGGPVAIGLPCGHTRRQMTLPIGQTVTLSVGQNELGVDFQFEFGDTAATSVAA